MTERKACYGKMLPGLSHEHLNERNHGKAFSVLVESSGIGIQKRVLSSKPDE